jgi:hypothetical protein
VVSYIVKHEKLHSNASLACDQGTPPASLTPVFITVTNSIVGKVARTGHLKELGGEGLKDVTEMDEDQWAHSAGFKS